MSSTISYTNYAVARGVIRIPSSITGMKDGSFARKNEFLRPGDAIPEGMLSDREMRQLLANGTIMEIATPKRVKAAAEAARKHMSRWSIDPASLGRKSFDELIVMIQEIDPQFPLETLEDEAAARRQLSKDFDPEFREDMTDVLGRDPVSRLTAQGVKDAGQGGLSSRAAERLAELQARAETPGASGGADDADGTDADASGMDTAADDRG